MSTSRARQRCNPVTSTAGSGGAGRRCPAQDLPTPTRTAASSALPPRAPSRCSSSRLTPPSRPRHKPLTWRRVPPGWKSAESAAAAEGSAPLPGSALTGAPRPGPRPRPRALPAAGRQPPPARPPALLSPPPRPLPPAPPGTLPPPCAGRSPGAGRAVPGNRPPGGTRPGPATPPLAGLLAERAGMRGPSRPGPEPPARRSRGSSPPVPTQRWEGSERGEGRPPSPPGSVLRPFHGQGGCRSPSLPSALPLPLLPGPAAGIYLPWWRRAGPWGLWQPEEAADSVPLLPSPSEAGGTEPGPAPGGVT
ncbi:uncharacterized protein [Taeniopygia guttata]|uniref:uncharacterized protein n=1 Tax=Taeniopygia guttata TaxID=59729 RepID=UPI003BB91C59